MTKWLSFTARQRKYESWSLIFIHRKRCLGIYKHFAIHMHMSSNSIKFMEMVMVRMPSPHPRFSNPVYVRLNIYLH